MPITSPPSSGGEIGSIPDNSIGNLKIASDAAIAWGKISKSGAAAADVGAAPSNNPTFTGTVTTSGAVINAGTAMTGEVINVALRNNLYSATANVTWTHSATPAVGQEYGVTVTTDGTARTIGLPVTCKSANAGGDVTAVTFPASSTTEIRIKRTASEYLITGDPVSKETVKAGLAITSSDLADFNSATRAQVEAMLIQSTNITLTPSGSGASRQIAVASSGGGGGGSGDVLSAAPVFAGAVVTTANAMGALEIDVTKALNTKTITGGATLSVSATPATANTRGVVRLYNDSATASVVALPSSPAWYSEGLQADITTFTAPPYWRGEVSWCYDGTRFLLKADPPTPAQGRSALQLGGAHIAEEAVASATTTAIGATTSENVSITGTTTITGFGTVEAGTKRWGRFTGVLTLTHNGTSLILPGAANITTAAGDRFIATSLGSGNWVVIAYTKANGEAVVSSGVGGGGGETWDASFDGQGQVVVSGTTSFRPVASTGTIAKAALVGDVSGAVTVTVKKYTPAGGALGSSTTLGTIALATAQHNSSTPSWAVTAGDVLEFSLGGTITSVTKVFVRLST